MRRAAFTLACAAAAIGCAKLRPLTSPTATSGSADFTRYVAMGTSISAGFQSGGLASRHQVLSFPYLFARQVGTPVFTFPAVNLGGWPPLLRLKSFGPPVVIDSIGVQRGAFINFAQPTPYQNLAVPGALLADVQNILLNYDPTLGRDASFFNNILREGQQTIPRSMLTLVTIQNPTFLSFEFGTSEVLAGALHGSAAYSSAFLPPANFGALLTSTLAALDNATPTAEKVIFDVPDVTTFPFFNALPIVELTAAGTARDSAGVVKFLLGGPNGRLAPGDRIGLNARKLLAGIPSVTNAPDSGAWGYATFDTSYLSGFPVLGNGRPLPDSVILTPTETASIQTSIDGYNSAIQSEATARNYALVSLHAISRDFAINGFHFAGGTYTTKFITGGLYSLDGVHFTDLAHGVICNEMIRVVNEKFDARIPPVDLSKSMTASSSAMARARP